MARGRFLAARTGALAAILLAAAIPAAAGPARAGAERDPLAGPVAAEVVRVVDGDTLEVTARLWPGLALSSFVRLAGIDAPELAGRCAFERSLARRARDLLAALLRSAGPVAPAVRLHDVRDGKFAGRVIARVETGAGLDIAERLLAAGLARPYHGGRRAPWCRAQERGSGPGPPSR